MYSENHKSDKKIINTMKCVDNVAYTSIIYKLQYVIPKYCESLYWIKKIK